MMIVKILRHFENLYKRNHPNREKGLIALKMPRPPVVDELLIRARLIQNERVLRIESRSKANQTMSLTLTMRHVLKMDVRGNVLTKEHAPLPTRGSGLSSKQQILPYIAVQPAESTKSTKR